MVAAGAGPQAVRGGTSPESLSSSTARALIVSRSPRRHAPLGSDETLASAALDFSGRPYFVFEGEFKRERVGDMPTELVPHFFRSLCDASGLNLNLQVRGDNDHHKVEACFKALARALRPALARQGTALPSTKGAL